MSDLRLAIFDVDGTLVDSQADILASMNAAFAAADVVPPSRAEILGIVGLSLPVAMATLAPGQPQPVLARMVEGYKDHYVALRQAGGPSPLYPGILDMLEDLARRDDLLLGVATGKSRRGLDALLDSLGLRRFFVNAQCADDHPSKPHPAMLNAALSETGCDASRAVMIGDTSFDMDMARAAGIAGVGVTWGYHARDRLAGAAAVVDHVPDLVRSIDNILDGGNGPA